MRRPLARSRGAHPGLALLLLGALAGCGGGSDTKSGEAAKPAKQIVADAAAQLASAHSFVADGRGPIEHQQTQISLEVERPGKVELSLQTGGRVATIRVVAGSAYLKANRAFYEGSHEQIPAAALTLLADRWLKSDESVDKLVKGLDPSTLAHCLATERGTLVNDGVTTLDGQRAVVVSDSGDVPGSTPARLYVAASGPPYLLRYVATGKQRPGGPRGGECNEATEPGQAGEGLTFSRYNAPLNISPPAGALELDQLIKELEKSTASGSSSS